MKLFGILYNEKVVASNSFSRNKNVKSMQQSGVHINQNMD